MAAQTDAASPSTHYSPKPKDAPPSPTNSSTSNADPRHPTSRRAKRPSSIASRRLVDLDDLADAIVWHDGHAHDDMADDLWVDRAMLLARIRSLDPEERAYIEAIVARREGSA